MDVMDGEIRHRISGQAILIILGNGAVANVELSN